MCMTVARSIFTARSAGVIANLPRVYRAVRVAESRESRTIPRRLNPFHRQDTSILKRERPYRTVSRRYLWRSAWYNVRQDQLEAADGSAAVYTVVEKPQAVWVVPVTDAGELVMIEQYRYPVDDWCLEVPAGNVEPGVSLEAMAVRELSEETGGRARELRYVGQFYSLTGSAIRLRMFTRRSV